MDDHFPKIGVVGVGHLGYHHVKHLATRTDAYLSGITDIDDDRAVGVSQEFGCNNFDSLEEMLENVDALSIVTPTPTHAEIAAKCISSGKHVFIEKPITKTVAEADELINMAKEQNVLIQVGHIERLNPALIPLRELDLNPKFIEVQRLAPYTVRGTDVPVVLDLMIHDIDIILSLVEYPVKNIRASGVSILSDSVDIANARLRFENGTVANITSSRIARNKIRKIKVFQKEMYATIDLLLGLTEVYRVLDEDQDNPDAIESAALDAYGNHKKIVYEKPDVNQFDALERELANFISAVNGDESPIVDGSSGREALDVATKIHEMILEGLH